MEGDKKMKNRIPVFVLVWLWIALAGCGSSSPSRFYMLDPLPAPQEVSRPEAGEGCISIGIGPIHVPAHLDRPQIVTRTGPNELQLSEYHRWAEPIKDAMARVLAENVSQLICTEAVVIYPWNRAVPLDYRITVEVIRLDGNPGGAVSFISRWSILDGEGKKMLMSRKSEISESVEGGDFQALVAAQSRTLASLSRQITSAIKGLAM
jgi:uncharacterized lipoprotein YmbA